MYLVIGYRQGGVCMYLIQICNSFLLAESCNGGPALANLTHYCHHSSSPAPLPPFVFYALLLLVSCVNQERALESVCGGVCASVLLSRFAFVL